jgi:hypothetical protein
MNNPQIPQRLLCMTIFSADDDPFKRFQVIIKGAFKTWDAFEAPNLYEVECAIKHLRHWATETHPDYKDWKVRQEILSTP